MADAPARKKITINTLNAKMKRGEPITQLAAYDYRTAVVADRLGMDILCVSDTGGMILFGHKSTVSVIRRSDDDVEGDRSRLQIWAAHGRHALLELPRFAGAGGRERRPFRARGQCRSDEMRGKQVTTPRTSRRSSRAGIPVQGNRHHADAHAAARRLRCAGQDAKRAKEMVEDAKAMVDAGCFSILCEVTTRKLPSILPRPCRCRS